MYVGVLHPGVPAMWHTHIRELSHSAEAVRGTACQGNEVTLVQEKQKRWSLTCVHWCRAVKSSTATLSTKIRFSERIVEQIVHIPGGGP